MTCWLYGSPEARAVRMDYIAFFVIDMVADDTKGVSRAVLRAVPVDTTLPKFAIAPSLVSREAAKLLLQKIILMSTSHSFIDVDSLAQDMAEACAPDPFLFH